MRKKVTMTPQEILNQIEVRMKEYDSLCTQLLKCEDPNLKNEIVADMLFCVGIIQNHECALKRSGLPSALE